MALFRDHIVPEASDQGPDAPVLQHGPGAVCQIHKLVLERTTR